MLCTSTPHTVSLTSVRSVSVGAAGVRWATALRRPPPARRPHSVLGRTRREVAHGAAAPPAGHWALRFQPALNAPGSDTATLFPGSLPRTRSGGLGPPPARLRTTTGSGKRGYLPHSCKMCRPPDPFRGPMLWLKTVTNNRRSHSMCSTQTLTSTLFQSPRSYDF